MEPSRANIISQKGNSLSTATDYRTMPDLGHQAPDLQPYLRPGEKVISINHSPTPVFEKLPDYRQELARLCRVDKPENIGKNGPPMAARAAKESAGQGLFECRFGRDGLIAAMDFLPEFPLLARTTLLDYATLIGMAENTAREEELGRMFHEARDENDPLAEQLAKERGWGWPFYATIDATPLFVIALCRYATETKEGASFLEQTYVGRDKKTYRMWQALEFSMRWIVSRVNRNQEGFLEYKPAFEGSHENQIMEDSYDSHFHEDGSLADLSQGNCATEVQGHTYDALVMAAELLETRQDFAPETAYWRKLAAQLRGSIFKHLWVANENGGYFAVGADRDQQGYVRPLKVLKAIPFFLLNSRLFDNKQDETNRRMVDECVTTLFTPALLCAGGIRSLALGQPRFMPGAYHNGSSWLMQTFQIAQGLRRQGYATLAENLDRRVVRAVEETNLYPEYVRGGLQPEIRLNERVVYTHDPLDNRENGREQPPQQIQLWSLTAYGAIRYRQSMEASQTAMQPIEERVLDNV